MNSAAPQFDLLRIKKACAISSAVKELFSAEEERQFRSQYEVPPGYDLTTSLVGADDETLRSMVQDVVALAGSEYKPASVPLRRLLADAMPEFSEPRLPESGFFLLPTPIPNESLAADYATFLAKHPVGSMRRWVSTFLAGAIQESLSSALEARHGSPIDEREWLMTASDEEVRDFVHGYTLTPYVKKLIWELYVAEKPRNN